MKTARMALVASLCTALVFTLSSCADRAKAPDLSQTDPLTPTPQMTEENKKQITPPTAGDTIAVIETEMGAIKLKLFNEQVPEMTKNFMELANAGNFDNVPFHRVIKGFMVQTGDFTKGNGTGGHSYKGPGTELPDEIVPSLSHLYGAVSMANSGPNTNGSQFFIVTGRNGALMLDGGYTIIGQVYEGMDAAEKIAELYDPSSGDMGIPTRAISMTKVTVMPYTP